ncbi:MAG: tRNA uridine-5-carboxymethylaminomethyl(34) synthesis GTPase MnmE [Firmicutes bacterium]|nr:tRNA uridine-5-carboxymethylaminomethyl(34) synthesis GTPase MnmE [Bacillota bacterium]
MKNNDRTIAAISTPVGLGGICVIRVSGGRAVEICDSVFRGGKRLSEVESHTVHYGHIVDKDGTVIDEVLATVMLAPKTYTREDVVEISTHGGILASKKVMDTLIMHGTFPAEPGEFTKRAFLNGRIDLSQAEGVIDIITSKTDAERKNALFQAEGGLFKEISEIRKKLVNLAAKMQVAIDYPDEDLEDVTETDIIDTLSEVQQAVMRMLATKDSGKIIREGIKTAIVGKPNVGKSSLLNCLAKEDRAIVTDISGTTRDIIEEFVSLDGVPLRLLDTAGIRETDDAVEKIGVERAKAAIDEADLVILVVDLSRKEDREDRKLLELVKNKKHIKVANKSDIKSESILADVEISSKTGEGIDKLAEMIKKMYNFAEIESGDTAIITNMRHIAALSNTEEALSRAKEQLECGMPQDIAALDINEAIDFLGEITGEKVSEDIVSEIFHSFCVGK